MLINVIDFETTGFPPDASIVEIGCTGLHRQDDGSWRMGETTGTLVKPSHKISFEAMAVHHITEDMVADAPLFGQIPKLPAEDAVYLAAHNVEFDRKFYKVSRPWICTLKCARRIWPEAPAFGNNVLRYWLDLQFDDEERTLPSHRAGPDSYVTATLLQRMLEEHSVETLVQWSNEKSLLPKVTFGKHRGTRWEDVPQDYLDWVANKSTLNPDVKYTAKHWLKQRQGR